MNQTITEKKLLKQFTSTQYIANCAANQRLKITFRNGYPLTQTQGIKK